MDIQYLGLLFFFSLLFLSISFLFPKRNKLNHPNPDLKPYPILGHLPQFLKHRHRILDWTTDILSSTPTNTFHFHRPGNVNGVITANPTNVEHMLKSRFDTFPKGPRFHSILQDFLGDGIFNADGHLWKVQRKTASLEFNTRSLRNFVVENVQHETADRLLPLLKRCADHDDHVVVDMQDVLERYAFDNVCKVAFDQDPACLSNETDRLSSGFANAFRDAAELSAGRFRYAVPVLWKVKKLFGIGSESRLKESIGIVHDFAINIIRSRKKEIMHMSSKTQADDLLSRFISIEEYLDDKSLRDIVISFILAGRETTSSALTWFFWLVSSRPHVQAQILAEIASVRARRGEDYSSRDVETFEFDELREMQYLHAAITESMRLYPPVPFNTSMCQEDHVLPDGTEIKKGWFMSYNSYAMGRMETIWGEDCREYRPERWLDSEGRFKAESPFKFLAFHAGPRMCLGKEMAYIQMKSIAACVMQRFEVEVVEKEKIPEQTLSLTLRMRGGLPVRVRKRSVATGRR